MAEVRLWHTEQGSGSASSALRLVPHEYRIGEASSGQRSPALDEAWQAFLRSRDPVNAVHQTPAYIEHLADTGRRPEVLVLHDNDDRVAGIVPVRRTKFVVSWSLGARTLLRLRLRSLIILGSEPMVVDDRRALDALFIDIADRYKDAQVVEMYSVRQDSAFWRYLTQSEAVANRYGIYVVGGFRDSFSVALPASVDDYLKKMSKKRRYNLKRQERLIEERLGHPLEMKPVADEANLPVLLDALADLGVATGPEAKFPASLYESAARNGILRCYVLACAGQTVGVATGIASDNALFVHDLYFNKGLAKLSPGTTLWQVLIRHLIEEGRVARVGISHGSPAYTFDEVNLVEPKGRVLLYRRTLANRLRFLAHAGHARMVAWAKRLPPREALVAGLRRLRGAAPASKQA